MKVQLKKVKAAGFSLVELLVVIAVIGIMAAIAIPMISNINQNATDAKNKRNAQQIASTYGAAAAAGAPALFSGDPPTPVELEAAITALTAGTPGAGQFQSTTFRVNLEGDELDAAVALLELEDGVMTTTY
jgi:type IV pilus assembly protein PilA